MPNRFDNCRVLFWSDPHFPYHHKDTLSFLSKVKDAYNPDRVICGGDLGDLYSVSNYPTDINHPDSFHTEVKGLRKNVKEVAELFPEQIVCSSNHDDRPYRKSTTAGIPREFLIPYNQVISAPDTWKWVPYYDLTVDADRSQWRFIHTINGGALVAAKNLGMNVCNGHSHTKFGAQSFSNGKKVLYGVDSGCLISDVGSPFKYQKGDIGRPIRGCVMILDGVPKLIPMR